MRYLLVFFFLVSTTVFSQKNSNYNRSHVIFPGCETTEKASKCYKVKMQQYFDSTITKDATTKLIQLSEKDTIKIISRLYFDEKGKVVKRHSKFSAFKLENHIKELDFLVDNFPKVDPVLDNQNNGVADLVTISSYYKIDRINSKLIPVKKTKTSKKSKNTKKKDFEVIETVPRYKGCGEELSNDLAKRCMNAKINMHVSKNFNSNIANRLNLSPGLKKIFVSFKINKKGKVDNISAIAPHPALEKEAIRVAKLIPKMDTPGIQRGKAVIVPYFLPIKLKIEETKAQKKERKRLNRKKKFN